AVVGDRPSYDLAQAKGRLVVLVVFLGRPAGRLANWVIFVSAPSAMAG
ncbi:MAG: hypothetical protein HC852_09045, partial [Acaryochloridaceae cyanobacterium RU_4_10]|nr:hypothetical protein [Acaryochloridaceae cyanobacterium RU_4_10]